jgi:hypothetical protein
MCFKSVARIPASDKEKPSREFAQLQELIACRKVLSAGNPKSAGASPAAITSYRPSKVSSLTRTVVGPANRARPWNAAMPAFAKSSSRRSLHNLARHSWNEAYASVSILHRFSFLVLQEFQWARHRTDAVRSHRNNPVCRSFAALRRGLDKLRRG